MPIHAAAATVTFRQSDSAPSNGMRGLAFGLLARLTRPTDGDRRRSEAAATLRDSGSDEDSREWAERYLCGMTEKDLNAFMTNRPARS